jgi:hypothetical protein
VDGCIFPDISQAIASTALTVGVDLRPIGGGDNSTTILPFPASSLTLKFDDKETVASYVFASDQMDDNPTSQPNDRYSYLTTQ